MQSLVQQQYEAHTEARVAIDALDNEDNRANAVAAPLRGQTTASCRSTRADLENKKSSAPSARLSWLRIIREYTQQQQHRTSCWARMLG